VKALTFGIGAVVVVYFLAMEAIDMAGRIEYVRDNFPGLLRWVEHRAWYRILLLVTAAMVAGGLWETIQQPIPPIIMKPPVPPILSTQQPPLVIQNTIDPKALAEAMAEVEQHQKSQNNQSPLATKLLALSKSILGFALERGREAPPMTVLKSEEEINKRWSEQVRFSQETQNQYALKFGAELAVLLQEVKATGVDLDNWDWRCGPVYAGSTLSSIQQCAAQLGVFADQVH
jgi:hypothetical protein